MSNSWLSQAELTETVTDPLVRGMARTSMRDRARDRILNDDEIRALWQATLGDGLGRFGRLVRVLLLTGQRREEVAGMRWSEIEGDIWTVPAQRAKNGKPNDVPLTASFHGELNGITPLGDFVFGRRGDKPFSGFSKAKRELDDAVRKILGETAHSTKSKPWVLHDLRRTARSLLSRAGVGADVGERVLAHTISGIRGVYDRHQYVEEKRDALQRLAALIERIARPDPNVFDLSARR
jgi:integrase